MSEITLDIEESINQIPPPTTNIIIPSSPADPNDVNINVITISPTHVSTTIEDEPSSTNLTTSEVNNHDDASDATEQNPLNPTKPLNDSSSKSPPGEDLLTTTIIHHHHPIYAQYCFCCPQIVSTKPKLFFTTCCVLSLVAGIFLTLCFFYPEQLFGVQSDVLNKLTSNNNVGYGHHGAHGGQIIHHPHQNRKISHSFPSSSSSSSRRTLSTHSGGGGGSGNNDDTDNNGSYDDSLAAGNLFISYNSNSNSGYAAVGNLNSNSNNNYKQIVNFDELTQTFNYSNVIQTRLLHLDLKGAPPSVSYMKEVMRLGKEAGITGLLIEWEDTFPWKGILINTTLADGTGYSDDQVHEILDYAEHELELDVIPLIQTFGHVEYILKTMEFFHLREDPNDPQSFCPSLKETLELIQEMINQIIVFHKNSKFIHIGCDEVFNIGLCPLCSAHADRRSSAYNNPNEVLFLQHVSAVGEMVKSTGRIPIIWDDMLRTISYEKLNEFKIGSTVEPMVWVYAEDIDKFITGEQWMKYNKIFSTIWTAGAFKGAFGETLQLPPIKRHAENTQTWIHVASRESTSWDYGIGGIVLTGWSRYDHFSVLCEILPSAIPTLIYTALVLSIPSSDSKLIKNRIFVPTNHLIPNNNNVNYEINDTKIFTSSSSDLDIYIDEDDGKISSPLDLLSTKSRTSTSTARSTTTMTKRRRRRKRSNGNKWAPHPQSLRINSVPIISTFSGSSLSHETNSERLKSESTNSLWKSTEDLLIEKYTHLNKEFARILHCSFHQPIEEFQLPTLIQDEESGGIISSCNFQGVNFYRSLLRLRILLDEIWNLDISLSRERGWVGAYNQRHNYSSPHRLDSLIFNQIPKYKRNLLQISKTIGLSLKKLYLGPVILEWLELNVWNAWLLLDGWEKVGDNLKSIKSWKRRPLRSPEKMIHDLGLLPLQLVGAGYDKNNKDEL